MSRLSIACAVDGDIVDAVARGDRATRRAQYDISVVRALRRLGHAVHLVAADQPAGGTIEELRRVRPDLVFNLAFSATPMESAFAGALETLGIPYTGSGPLGIALANDKIRSRLLLHAAGVPVPRFVPMPPDEPPQIPDFAPPFIVKPVSLGNSMGIHGDSLVGSLAEAARHAERIWRRFRVAAVCDQFVRGREFQVGLVEGRRAVFDVTTVVELRFIGVPGGVAFKTEAVTTGGRRRRVYEYSLRPARLAAAKRREIIDVSYAAAKVLGLRGYAKIDLRTDEEDRPIVLEANANPGILSTAHIWRTPGFELNLRRMIAAALRKAHE